MAKSRHDTFALVINFINSHWVPSHVTMGLFEAINKSKVAMVAQVKELLLSYNLLDKLITYVKEKGGNLSTHARSLNYVDNCAPLKHVAPGQGSRFGHAFSKATNMLLMMQQICLSFQEVNLKATRSALQKTITWTKKSNKGWSEWKRACLDVGLRHPKLKTPVKTRFASKVILFQKTLEYRDAINLCYGKHETLDLHGCALDA